MKTTKYSIECNIFGAIGFLIAVIVSYWWTPALIIAFGVLLSDIYIQKKEE